MIIERIIKIAEANGSSFLYSDQKGTLGTQVTIILRDNGDRGKKETIRRRIDTILPVFVETTVYFASEKAEKIIHKRMFERKHRR